ncbi:hypothetical protein ACFGVR_11170 [Mucilaginibacter sp. AW1-3]
MKRLLSVILLFISVVSVKGQSLTRSAEWPKLITALENEDWSTANQLSLTCLKRISPDMTDSGEAGMLRYMFIISEAGLMNDGKRTKDQAYKEVKGFQGHFILLAGHPTTLKFASNSIMPHNDKTDSLFVNCTNNAGTNIFSFEYIIPKEKWDIDDFKANIGKIYRAGGILKSISAEGNMLPRFRIIVSEAELRQEQH